RQNVDDRRLNGVAELVFIGDTGKPDRGGDLDDIGPGGSRQPHEGKADDRRDEVLHGFQASTHERPRGSPPLHAVENLRPDDAAATSTMKEGRSTPGTIFARVR